MASAKLSVGAFGGDVASLHSSLTSQGLTVPSSEVARQFFGPGTRQAVQQFQQKQGLPATGELDTTTQQS
jgi:peptidoglycan hydrolase-like protein with peptidoglycan-binding domain